MTPFDWVAPEARWRLFAVLTVTVAALSFALSALGEPLVTAEAPAGILSFEFAGTNQSALRMVESWGPEGREAACLVLGLDYLYLVVYPAWFALGCLLLATGLAGGVARAGRAIAWVVCTAGAFDAVENAASLALMGASPAPGLAALAFGCATLKFAGVGLAALYWLVAGAARLARQPG
jgi:hypothetical protein